MASVLLERGYAKWSVLWGGMAYILDRGYAEWSVLWGGMAYISLTIIILDRQDEHGNDVDKNNNKKEPDFVHGENVVVITDH